MSSGVLRGTATVRIATSTVSTFYCFSDTHRSDKRGYTLLRIYTTEKRKRGRLAREQRLLSAEQALAKLTGKLNTRSHKTKQQIADRLSTLLEQYGVREFYHTRILPIRERSQQQLGKGRTGKNTRYKNTTRTIYSLAWSRNKQRLAQERRVDGIFPILCTDNSLSAKQALEAYKYQPRLEKRFQQLKDVHHVAPTLFKKVERVEAMMFVFFMALILQAVIEREVRLAMEDVSIDAIPIYPEHRLAYHPTTAKIFDRFQNVSLYRIVQGGKLLKQYQDELTTTQLDVLTLLGMSERNYWNNVITS